MSDSDVHALKFLPLEERGDPRFAPPETELVRWMYTIEPGETRVWHPPKGASCDRDPEPRFMCIAQQGDVPDLVPVVSWTADICPRLWEQTAPDIPERPISSAPTPHYRYRRGAKIPHLFGGGTHTIVSGDVLACLSALDPGSFEMRDCRVDGLPNGPTFHAILPKRIWDVADPRRTSLEVKCAPHASGRYYTGRTFVSAGDAEQQSGLFLRDDIPENVHFFGSLWSSANFFVSRALMRAIQESAASGIDFISPEPPEWLSYNERISLN